MGSAHTRIIVAMAIDDKIIKPKSEEFALRIVKLYKELTGKRRENIMASQLLRSGTSIGANVNEAEYAISRAEFHSKMGIALKEAVESKYWIELLHRSEYLTKKEFDSLMADLEPIIKILTKIVKNSGSN